MYDKAILISYVAEAMQNCNHDVEKAIDAIFEERRDLSPEVADRIWDAIEDYCEDYDVNPEGIEQNEDLELLFWDARQTY